MADLGRSLGLVLTIAALQACASRPTATVTGNQPGASRAESRLASVDDAAGSKQPRTRDGAVDSAPLVESRQEDVWAAKRIAPEVGDSRLFNERPAFDEAAGAPPVIIDFDDLPDGASLEGRSMGHAPCPVRFEGFSAPLLVVRADRTRTLGGHAELGDGSPYRLLATSGDHLLSPGGVDLAPGPNPSLENDDILLRFDPPVQCIGFDVATPSADGMSFVDIEVVATDGSVLHRGRLSSRSQPRGALPYPPPSTDFFGFVAGSCVIACVRIDELDDNAICPDANIGLDSISIAPSEGPRAADIDASGQVDARDFAAVLVAMKDASIDAGARWRREDLNRDGRVDLEDVRLVERWMGF